MTPTDATTASQGGSQSNAVPSSLAPTPGGGDSSSSSQSEMATTSQGGSQSNAVPSSSVPPPGSMATASRGVSQSNAVSSSSVPPPDSSSSQSSSVAAGIGGGIAAAAVLLVVVLVVAVVVVLVLRQSDTVSVCLRKRKNKHVNTTDNVAYHCSGGPETMKSNEAYAEISDPSIATSTNDAYGITRGTSDVTTSQNEAYVATDGACQSSGSGMRMKTNEAYADMSSAINEEYIEDAYTYVTQRTTAVLTATKAAYNAHTSTDEVYYYPTSSTAGNDIATYSNAAYGITQQVNPISIAHATDKVHDIATSSNEAYGAPLKP